MQTVHKMRAYLNCCFCERHLIVAGFANILDCLWATAKDNPPSCCDESRDLERPARVLRVRLNGQHRRYGYQRLVNRTHQSRALLDSVVAIKEELPS